MENFRFVAAPKKLPLNLLPPPPPPRHRCRFLPAPLAASYRPPRRQPYRRRRRDGPPSRPPAPTSPPPAPQQQRPANAAAPSQDDLEEAIYDFMRRSDKPGRFPTREELVSAGRADLAAAVASSGGWLSLGWSSSSSSLDAADGGDSNVTASPVSSGGGHPDYPPQSGLYDRNLTSGAGDDYGSPCREEKDDEANEEEEASPSGRPPPETEEPREVRYKAGIEGMLTRLQRDREWAQPLPWRMKGGAGGSVNGALVGNNDASSHIAASSKYTPIAPENGNIHGSHPQNGTLGNDAWKTWSLGKDGLSDLEAAEILPTESRRVSEYGELDIHKSSNGVAVSEHPVDGGGPERDEIHSRLQSLELDLSGALKTLRSRFDKVLSDMSSGDGATVVDEVSDDWEFEETKVMQAQEELRSIRAKIAVLEGKMALEIIERNKIIEEKQRRLDEVEKALSELRTVYIVWPNPASEVLLVGSFDGWTNQDPTSVGSF